MFAPLGFTSLTPQQGMVVALLKTGIVALALWIAWRRRALPPDAIFSTLALVWAVFFVLAPGVGAQYLVWIAPFLLLDSAAWFAVVTVASGIFLGVFYQTISGGWPWFRGISTAELVSQWVVWTLLPWGALLGYVISRGKEICGVGLPIRAGAKFPQIRATEV